MQRLSNRDQSQNSEPIVQYVYVETQAPQSEAQVEIQYVDREVVKEIHVPSEHNVVVHKEVDLSGVHNKFKDHDVVLNYHKAEIETAVRASKLISSELEMQRRALVAIKMQRDVDRKRRLQLIQRLKRERNSNRKLNFKLKLAIGASLLLSIASLVVKL